MKVFLVFFAVAAMCVAAFGDTTSQLLKEFERRDQLKLSPDQGAAMNFLRSIAYPIQGIVEMDILTPSNTFVFRDRSGDVCFGDTQALVLRCKNEIGITGVTFQGDSD